MSLQGDCSDTETWKDSRGIAKLEVSIVKRIKDVTSGLMFLMLTGFKTCSLSTLKFFVHARPLGGSLVLHVVHLKV